MEFLQASSLTTGQDAKTLSAGADSISGSLVGAGAVGTTAQPGDTVNGGTGEDKLTLSVSGDSGGDYTLQALITDSIETLHVNNFETDGGGGANTVTTVDGALMKGLTEVGLASSGAEGDTKFDNVMNIVDVAMQNGSGDLEVAYGAGVTTGTQTQNIALSNVAAGTLAIAGVENLNVSSGLVKSTLTALTAANMQTLTVTGSTDLKITGALDFKNATSATALDGTVDASDFTGKLNVTSAADVVSITGGTGNDTINMAATLNGLDTVDGGDGTDTLTMDGGAITTQFAKVSNIENVTFNDTATGFTAAANKLSAGVENITLTVKDDTLDGNETAFAVSGYNDAQTVIITRADFDTDLDDAPAITVTSTVDTAEDSVNVKFLGIGENGDDGAGVAADEFGLGTLDVSNYETINLDSSKTLTVTKNELIALTGSSATALNISGNANLTIGTSTLNAKATSVDASGLAAALTYNAGSEKAEYKLGQKSSTINFAGNFNASDSVVGGAGSADIVTATVTGLSATTGAIKTTDVEYVLLTTSGANTLDLSGTSGLSNLAVTDNKQTIKGLDLTTTTVHLGLAGDASATSSEIDVTAADATGADDTLGVIINTTAAAAVSIIDASAIENLSVTVGRSTTGTNKTATLDLTTFEGNKVSIGTASLAAGATVAAGAVDLGTLHKNTTTLVSANKAAVTASMANATTVVSFEGLGARAQTITGGLRGDTFNIGTTAAIAHVITGGAGSDVTNITATTGLADVSRIDTETVNITFAPGVSNDFTGSSFGTGVDFVTATGGNTLSSLNLGTLVDQVRSIDASGYQGVVTATVATDKLDSTISITAGDKTTDEVIAQLDTDATYVPKTTAVEILDLDINGDITVDVSGTSGVSRVEVDISTAAKTATVSNVEGQQVRLTGSANANNVLEVKPVDSTEDDNTISFVLADDATITADTKLKTTDVETVNITSATAESVDLSLLTMTTATKTIDLNLFTSTTFAGITLSATSAQTTTINAAGAYGVIQTGRSATTAVDYTGSAGNDTFIMMNVADKIAGGAGTSDTLDVNYAAVLGGISVDLSATGEQISTLDGGAISGSVTGFENVDLSGYTGFGASVTAVKTGSIITGTAATDRITLGAGADTIKVATITPTGADVVNSFTVGASKDKIDVAALADADFDTAGANILATTGFVVLGAANDVVASLTADLATAELAAYDAQIGAGEAFFFAVDDGVSTGIFYFADADGDAGADAGESVHIMTLVGIADATTVIAANVGL